MPRKGQRRYKNWLTEGFPGWLQERLEERDWLAVDLAEKLTVNSGVISNYMNGSRQPDPKMLNRIADVLGVSDEEVFTAAGYLREMTLPDDPRRLELMRRVQGIDLTPDRYDMLSKLLASWQSHHPLPTAKREAATHGHTSHTVGPTDDRSAETPRSVLPDENTRLDKAG